MRFVNNLSTAPVCLFLHTVLWATVELLFVGIWSITRFLVCIMHNDIIIPWENGVTRASTTHDRTGTGPNNAPSACWHNGNWATGILLCRTFPITMSRWILDVVQALNHPWWRWFNAYTTSCASGIDMIGSCQHFNIMPTYCVVLFPVVDMQNVWRKYFFQICRE